MPIGERVTAAELRAELVSVGAQLLVDSLTAGLGAPQPQQGEAVYAAKIDPAELRIDWSRPAVELDRLVRLGGAWSTFRTKRIKIVAAEPWTVNSRPGSSWPVSRWNGPPSPDPSPRTAS